MRSALIGALILVVAACARPTSTAHQTVPTPSPSPTPTTPLALTATAPFHTGEVGVAYAPVALSATGGVQPYTWSVVAGALPAGLSIGSDGAVSGTPTSAGTFSFSIQAADSGNSTATIPGSVPIAPALSASLIPDCTTNCWVELGCVSVCGAFGAQSGGVGPYSYALTSGQLPAGTTLSGLSLTGTFVGLTGYLQFTVQVTDSLGANASVAPVFWMHEHISFAGGNVTCPYNGCAGLSTFLYQGGRGTPAVQVTAWRTTCTYPPCYVPPTPAVSASGGSVSIKVPPSGGGNGYQGVLTLALTDQSPCGQGVNCSTSGTVNVVVQSG